MKRGLSPDRDNEGASPAKKLKVDREAVQKKIHQVMTLEKKKYFRSQWEQEGLTSLIEFEDLFIIETGEILLIHVALYAPEHFPGVWDRFKDRFALSEMSLRAKRSMLSALAHNSYLRKSIPFILVWEKFVEGIKLEDLLYAPVEVEGIVNICVLDSLSCAVDENRVTQDTALILHYILTQIPGVIPDEALNSVSPLSLTKKTLMELLSEQSQLITARNIFFQALADGKTFESLFELAKEAQDAGFLNAFYELGTYALSKNEHEIGFRAYREVPENSRHYQAVCLFLSQHIFGQSFEAEGEFAIKQQLHSALEYALKIKDELIKAELVQSIGSRYMFSSAALGNYKLVPQAWLDVLIHTKEPENCFSILDSIKQDIDLRAKVEQLRSDVTVQKELSLQQQQIIKHLEASKQPGINQKRETLK